MMLEDNIIYERDVWITNYFKAAENDKYDVYGKRTIKELWERAKMPKESGAELTNKKGKFVFRGLNDSASISTYHRIVNKLLERGLLEMDSPASDGVNQFKIAPKVSALQPISHQDLNQALWELGPVESLTRYIDTIDEFDQAAESIFRKAADGLLHEEPKKLLLNMLKDIALEIDYDIADLRGIDSDRSNAAHRRKVEKKLQDFSRLVNSELGISPFVWLIPLIEDKDVKEDIGLADPNKPESIVTPQDWGPIEEELNQHVFGKTFIELVEATPQGTSEVDLIVGGTDGSSHSDHVNGMPAAAYVDDERLMLTFNNAAGFVDVPDTYPENYSSPFHGIPITRSAVEDPSNKGMIISRPWFPDLEDGEFEHMKKVALDVVQYRIDEAMINGAAMPYGSPAVNSGNPLPRPNLLLRDGTVIPQAREAQNYTNRTSYGQMVREGIKLCYRILRTVKDSKKQVYAGAVKSTQLRVFTKILNWYIRRGSRFRYGTPIEPNWDYERMNIISDSVSIRKIFSALPVPLNKSHYYRTCVLVRPFPAIVTGLYRYPIVDDGWIDYFTNRSRNQAKEYEEEGGSPPYFYKKEVADDEYVKMCINADFGMFFIGKPGLSPQISFPRFDFMDSLRPLNDKKRQERVAHALDTILKGVHRTKWSLDFEHNHFSSYKLPKLIPYVVQEAHTFCKVLGHKLAVELQQAIAASLSNLKWGRILSKSSIDTEPRSVNSYKQDLKNMKKNIKDQGENIGDASPDDTGPGQLE